MTRLFFIPALALAAVATTPAVAEEHVWLTGDGFTVRTTGLDLTTPAGRVGLLRRIETASQRLCAGVTPRVSRTECAERAADRAVAAAGPVVATAFATAQIERQSPRYAVR